MKFEHLIQINDPLNPLMEPLTLGEGSPHRAALNDLAFDLAQKAAGFRRSLPPSLLVSLATLVRANDVVTSQGVRNVWFTVGMEVAFRGLKGRARTEVYLRMSVWRIR